VPNVLDRYSIQSTNPDLVYNKDGSLEIYMQANAPPPEHQGREGGRKEGGKEEERRKGGMKEGGKEGRREGGREGRKRR